MATTSVCSLRAGARIRASERAEAATDATCSADRIERALQSRRPKHPVRSRRAQGTTGVRSSDDLLPQHLEPLFQAPQAAADGAGGDFCHAGDLLLRELVEPMKQCNFLLLSRQH